METGFLQTGFRREQRPGELQAGFIRVAREIQHFYPLPLAGEHFREVTARIVSHCSSKPFVYCPMSVLVRVYFDYVCPFCYLAEFPLRQAAAGKPIEIAWMPYELRPEPEPPLRPEGEYLRLLWHQSVFPLAAQLGVPIRFPQISPQPHTRLAMEGDHFAKEHGKADDYHQCVMQAYFQDEKNIGDIGVLGNIADKIGLPAGEFTQALREGRFRSAHQRALRHAYYVMGITSVPTLVVGHQRLSGLQSVERLEHVFRQALEEDSLRPIASREALDSSSQ